MIISRKFLTTLFLIPLVCATLFPFSVDAAEKRNSPVVLSGTVCTCGSEPFSYSALKVTSETEKDCVYKISSNAKAKEIQALQGVQLVCTSYILNDTTIEVLEYSVLP